MSTRIHQLVEEVIANGGTTRAHQMVVEALTAGGTTRAHQVVLEVIRDPVVDVSTATVSRAYFVGL